MKNKTTKALSLVAAALLVLSTNSILAQETEAVVCKPHDVSIGVIGGANLSMLYAGSNEVNKNYDFGIGYNVGLTGSYAFNDVFSVVSGVNFAKLSSERKDMQPLLPNSTLQNPSYPLYANYKKTEKFDYIEVPVMIRVTTGKKVKVYVNAGPYIGFAASAKIETSGRSMLYKDLAGQLSEGANNTLYSFDGNQTVTSNITTVTFGVTGGAGIGYTFSRHSIVLDARYDIGLTNIRLNTAVNGKNNLQTMMLGLGYSYSLFK